MLVDRECKTVQAYVGTVAYREGASAAPQFFFEYFQTSYISYLVIYLRV